MTHFGKYACFSIFGDTEDEQCAVPELPKGKKYVAVAAGGSHSIVLRDDGVARAFICNDNN